jgi:hypothetical protein
LTNQHRCGTHRDFVIWRDFCWWPGWLAPPAAAVAAKAFFIAFLSGSIVGIAAGGIQLDKIITSVKASAIVLILCSFFNSTGGATHINLIVQQVYFE